MSLSIDHWFAPPDDDPAASLEEARESLSYWEERSRRLPVHNLRGRREAREIAARWRVRVADAEWVMRPSPAIRHWDGETLDLGHGLTLVRGGGHFRGGTMLHVAAGAGSLLTGDIVQVVPDRSHVAFMWSYPNLVPLPDASVRAIAAAVEPFAFEALYGAWWTTVIPADAKEIVRRSAARYTQALREVLG